MNDVIIVGGGPAGITAGIYCKRAGLDVCVFEKMFIGGQIAITSELDNYPGFETAISGADFALKLGEQAEHHGIDVVYEDVINFDFNSKIKKVITDTKTYEAKAIILAMGAHFRTIGIDSEALFTGRGVSYCATCDGGFYKDKVVAVIGGGNTALEEALYLANIAKTVYIVHRRQEFRGSKVMVDKILKKENIHLILDAVVVDVVGEKLVNSMKCKNLITDAVTNYDVDGIFVSIGRVPETEVIKDNIVLLDHGYIITDNDMKTNVDGIFAAGDICVKKLRQVVTAVSDGAIAGNSAIDFLQNQED